MKEITNAPSYPQFVAARAAYEADPTPENGLAWAIAHNKCRKEVGMRYFLPAAMLA